MAAAVAYLFGFEDAAGAAARGRLVVGDAESNPNGLGHALTLPVALAIGGVVGLRGLIPKALAAMCVGLMGVGIYISMSRGALLALIVTIAVLLYRMRVRRHVVVVMVVLLAVATMMPDAFYERVGSVATGEDSTGAGRTEIWAVGLKALERFGILGAGLDNFPDVHRLYAAARRGGFAAHNIYLMMWVEAGIIGLALMLAALGSHLLAARSARKADGGGVALSAVEAGCVGTLVLNLFGDGIWDKMFWLSWILLIWAIHCARESAVASEPPARHEPADVCAPRA
jgi:O-antigen ligase